MVTVLVAGVVTVLVAGVVIVVDSVLSEEVILVVWVVIETKVMKVALVAMRRVLQEKGTSHRIQQRKRVKYFRI